MAVANCKRCGQMYNRTNRDICSDCIAEEEEAFQLVRAYLKEHPDANFFQVVSGTEVDEEFILDMLYQGRLYLGDNPNVQYACNRCGEPTNTGRYCSRCAEVMDGAFESVKQDLQKRQAVARRPGYFSK